MTSNPAEGARPADAGDGSTEYYERDYAGFANDACYEFFVRVGVKSAAPAEQTLERAIAAFERCWLLTPQEVEETAR